MGDGAGVAQRVMKMNILVNRGVVTNGGGRW